MEVAPVDDDAPAAAAAAVDDDADTDLAFLLSANT